MNDPIDTWLAGGNRTVAARFHNKRISVVLVDECSVAAMGDGATLMEACADALNDIMRRDEQRCAQADALRAAGDDAGASEVLKGRFEP